LLRLEIPRRRLMSGMRRRVGGDASDDRGDLSGSYHTTLPVYGAPCYRRFSSLLAADARRMSLRPRAFDGAGRITADALSPTVKTVIRHYSSHAHPRARGCDSANFLFEGESVSRHGPWNDNGKSLLLLFSLFSPFIGRPAFLPPKICLAAAKDFLRKRLVGPGSRSKALLC